MINPVAAALASEETLKYMVEHAAKKGEIVTADEIVETMLRDPKGNTAKFFGDHLKLAYKTIMETVKNEK